MVGGKLQIEGEVSHVVARRCFNLNGLLHELTTVALPLTLARADETTAPSGGSNKGEQQTAKQKEVFYKGRNFR